MAADKAGSAGSTVTADVTSQWAVGAAAAAVSDLGLAAPSTTLAADFQQQQQPSPAVALCELSP